MNTIKEKKKTHKFNAKQVENITYLLSMPFCTHATRFAGFFFLCQKKIGHYVIDRNDLNGVPLTKFSNPWYRHGTFTEMIA